MAEAHSDYRKSYLPGLVVFFTVSGLLAAQVADRQGGAASAGHDRLFLVAGTSLVGDDGGEPTTLYLVSPNGQLTKVRRLVEKEESGEEAGYSVIRRSDSALFIVSNSRAETTVLHFDDPDRIDRVALKSIADSGTIQSITTPFTASPDGSLGLILASIDEGAKISLHTIMEHSGNPQRVNLGKPSDYSSLIFYGTHGGGEPDIGLTAKIVGNAALTGPSGDISIDRDLAGAPVHSGIMSICAATTDYLILSKRYIAGGIDEGQLPQNAELFVHKKARQRWETLKIEGNSTIAMQLFGPWLTYTVGRLSFGKHESGPGRERERKAATWEFPSVQAQYEALPVFYPGVLCLLNVEENRTIRINTGQEDSEVLLVDAQNVFYRVNDIIYRAPIVGNNLGSPAVIARGDDIPEVHWAFYGR